MVKNTSCSFKAEVIICLKEINVVKYNKKSSKNTSYFSSNLNCCVNAKNALSPLDMIKNHCACKGGECLH